MTRPNRRIAPVLAGLALLAAPALAQNPSPRLPNGQNPRAQDPRAQGGGPKPMLLPQAVVLPRGDREIRIDGSLIDWPKLPAMRLDDRRQLSGTAQSSWRSPNDCSAVVFMMWDDVGLYVSCTAKDEWHRALDARTLNLIEIPAADSLVLSFDPDRDTRSNGADPGREEDREFWLADENGREVVQWDRLRGAATVLAAPARMVVLHDLEQGLTTYEALITWPEILPPGRVPEVGSCIDLQLVLNDFDEKTDSMPQTRIGWTFGMGPVVDPGLFGTIMLVGDDAALQGVVPEFPPKPAVKRPPVEPAEYWRDLTAELLAQPPEVYTGEVTPAEVGGVERFAVLEKIDEHYARFPRVDFLELHQRVHRRMRREVAGLVGRGLPRWWRERLHSVSKLAEDAVPDGALRVFRLPAGGWLVRSAKKNFLIDAAGSDVSEWLWGGAEMCLLTQPLDMTRRNDQLLLRMYAAKPVRPVFTHIVFHLPVVPMEKMPTAKLGRSYGDVAGTSVTPLGAEKDDGKVPYDAGYRVQIDGASTLLVVGPTLAPESVPEGDYGLMIASPRNPRIAEIAERAAPRMIVIDDVFVCQTHPTTRRVALRDAHRLQRALLPHRSVLLGPGESWTLEKAPDDGGK